MSRHYPVSLILEGRPCLVVGAGRVAERKVRSLLASGARVRVVGPEATPGLRRLSAGRDIELELRAAGPGDLPGAWLVIIATDDPDLNAQLFAEADRRGLLVNVVDAPALCNFHVPAAVVRGPVQVAVSTGGAAPALAKRLRQLLEQTIPPEWGHLAAVMGELRPQVMERWPTPPEREAAWNRLLESDVLQLLAEDQHDEARRRAREVLGLQPPYPEA
jgi:precorrin-2 dehydrogenase/sirohydrochlorin ferrochelatase